MGIYAIYIYIILYNVNHAMLPKDYISKIVTSLWLRINNNRKTVLHKN